MSLLSSALLAASLTAQGAPPPAVEPAPPAWSLVFETYASDPPGDDPYVLGILYADRGPLHLEARYGYEDRDTFSFFVGRNFGWEAAVSGTATPMLGLVVGRTEGIAPAVELELDWLSLWLTSQAEYVFDTDDSSESYFYAWNELGWNVFERVDVGLVAQRTRIFEQELEVDRGLFVAWSGEKVGLSLYVFNPDQDDPYLAFTLNLGF
jgi:hypothetical protein